MKLEHLEYLCRIVPGMSLNALSESMHISQQGLSSAIMTLEREMGCTLLERTNKGVYFTPAGETLVQHTKTYLNNINKIKHAQNPLYENLSISILPNLISVYKGEFVSQFMSKNPHINLSCNYPSPITKCLEQVANDVAELAFVLDIKYGQKSITNTAQLALENNCIFIPSQKTALCIECHKDFLRAHTEQPFLKELSYKNCIINAQPHSYLEDFEMIFKMCNCSSKIFNEPNETIYFERLLNKQGFGFSMLMVQNIPEQYHNHIKRIQIKDPINVEIGYVLKATAKPSLAAQRMLDLLNYNN